MCKKLTLICIVLALVSTSYGYVIGDWESTASTDGWANDPTWAPQGYPEMYPGQPIYNTLNDASMLIIGPIEPNAMYWQIWIDLGANGDAKAAFAANTTLKIDVTRPTEYWTEDTDPETPTVNGFQIAVLGGGPGGAFQMESVDTIPVLCEWDGTDNAMTLSYNYVAAMGTEDVMDTAWWLQIIVGTHVEGYSEGGVWYLDNATLVPEPITIALLGLGGLSLLRKKR
ncbi:MAG: PEP-CTERM sorting domain-containing protein [Phycisphaerae bacterium]